MNVRPMHFERRSLLPVSAACLVANAARETLASLFNAPVLLRLTQPVVPGGDAWTAIARDALLVRVHGSVCEAAFVLRPRDALALSAAAFGEEPGNPRELSPVEREVVFRALGALSGALGALCGRDAAQPEPILDIRGYVTYFELLVEQPVLFRLGIAVGPCPLPRGGATVRIQDLLDVEVEVGVQFAGGMLAAGSFLNLGPGANVPMKTRRGEPGLLVSGGFVLARGECGVLGERNAMIVSAAP